MKFFTKKDNSEYEFLPAALEIVESPASPKGAFVIYGIFFMLFTALVWSYFGRIDEVAIARGKIITDGRIKVIQPVEEGVIKSVYVSEGQKVKQGELLVELDSSLNNLEKESLENALNTSKIEKEILLFELNGKPLDSMVTQKLLTPENLEIHKKYKDARDMEHQSKLTVLNSTLEQKQIEKKSLESALSRIQKELTLLKTDENKLYNDYINAKTTKKDWEKKKDELFMKEKDYEMQKLKIEENGSQIIQSNKHMQALVTEKNSKILSQIVDTEKKINQYESAFMSICKKIDFQKLRSPVDGTVHMMSTNTIGGVVTPAQAIMSIVPNAATLIVEATALNKDIGFIKLNQECEIKLDTFPFQKYGIVKGNIIEISPDAVDDEKLGPVYKIKVSLAKSQIIIDKTLINLSPGMTVSSEVKIGSRRIIEFFLEPLIKYAEESLELR